MQIEHKGTRTKGIVARYDEHFARHDVVWETRGAANRVSVDFCRDVVYCECNVV
jgi:hypothetical protein